MSLGKFLFVLFAAWCTIHISYCLSQRRRSSLLPVYSAVSVFGATHVTLSGLHLRISTTKWNTHHDKVITFLARRRNRRVSSLLMTLYNFGVLLGAIGMMFAILFCLAGLWCAIAERFVVARGSGVPTSNLFKRLVEDTYDYHPSSLSSPSQFPIITPVVSEY